MFLPLSGLTVKHEQTHTHRHTYTHTHRHTHTHTHTHAHTHADTHTHTHTRTHTRTHAHTQNRLTALTAYACTEEHFQEEVTPVVQNGSCCHGDKSQAKILN